MRKRNWYRRKYIQIERRDYRKYRRDRRKYIRSARRDYIKERLHSFFKKRY